MADDDTRRRMELLEESLAELLEWAKRQDVYDDQFADETAWMGRLEPHVRADGLAPLEALYEDHFVRLDELSAELETVLEMVERADALLAGGRYEAALGRARLRRRLAQRRPEQSTDS